jgi:hypothetical protein
MPEVGDYGGVVPVIPHFRRSAKRCAPKNKPLPFKTVFNNKKIIARNNRYK